ncbi:protein huluwa [Amia ocellicauda]|uniref:protein huluwa n=1 Tax=Amia ocellicauda TaxID=2972642 RepID=UPI0034646AAA
MSLDLTAASEIPASFSASFPIPALTLLVLLLIPCVVLLLLLNCLILGYKLFNFKKKRRKRRRLRLSDSSFSISTPSTRHSRVSKHTEMPPFDNQGGRMEAGSVSAKPVSSSAHRDAAGQRLRVCRPDGTTGEGSGTLRAASTIRAALSTSASTTRAELPRRPHAVPQGSSDWRRGGPLSSDSEADRADNVPPNSPATMLLTPLQDMLHRGHIRRSSTMELQNERHQRIRSPMEAMDFHYASSIPQEGSRVVTSASSSSLGPGLDSDFGASAGISLRILSSDNEGFLNPVRASGLEWDYYDPSFKRQNHVYKHMQHQLPPVGTQQYWV